MRSSQENVKNSDLIEIYSNDLPLEYFINEATLHLLINEINIGEIVIEYKNIQSNIGIIYEKPAINVIARGTAAAAGFSDEIVNIFTSTYFKSPQSMTRKAEQLSPNYFKGEYSTPTKIFDLSRSNAKLASMPFSAMISHNTPTSLSPLFNSVIKDPIESILSAKKGALYPENIEGLRFNIQNQNVLQTLKHVVPNIFRSECTPGIVQKIIEMTKTGVDLGQIKIYVFDIDQVGKNAAAVCYHHPNGYKEIWLPSRDKMEFGRQLVHEITHATQPLAMLPYRENSPWIAKMRAAVCTDYWDYNKNRKLWVPIQRRVAHWLFKSPQSYPMNERLSERLAYFIQGGLEGGDRAMRSVAPRFYKVVTEYVAEQARMPVPVDINAFHSCGQRPVITMLPKPNMDQKLNWDSLYSKQKFEPQSVGRPLNMDNGSNHNPKCAKIFQSVYGNKGNLDLSKKWKFWKPENYIPKHGNIQNLFKNIVGLNVVYGAPSSAYPHFNFVNNLGQKSLKYLPASLYGIPLYFNYHTYFEHYPNASRFEAAGYGIQEIAKPAALFAATAGVIGAPAAIAVVLGHTLIEFAKQVRNVSFDAHDNNFDLYSAYVYSLDLTTEQENYMLAAFSENKALARAVNRNIVSVIQGTLNPIANASDYLYSHCSGIIDPLCEQYDKFSLFTLPKPSDPKPSLFSNFNSSMGNDFSLFKVENNFLNKDHTALCSPDNPHNTSGNVNVFNPESSSTPSLPNFNPSMGNNGFSFLNVENSLFPHNSYDFTLNFMNTDKNVSLAEAEHNASVTLWIEKTALENKNKENNDSKIDDITLAAVGGGVAIIVKLTNGFELAGHALFGDGAINGAMLSASSGFESILPALGVSAVVAIGIYAGVHLYNNHQKHIAHKILNGIEKTKKSTKHIDTQLNLINQILQSANPIDFCALHSLIINTLDLLTKSQYKTKSRKSYAKKHKNRETKKYYKEAEDSTQKQIIRVTELARIIVPQKLQQIQAKTYEDFKNIPNDALLDQAKAFTSEKIYFAENLAKIYGIRQAINERIYDLGISGKMKEALDLINNLTPLQFNLPGNLSELYLDDDTKRHDREKIEAINYSVGIINLQISSNLNPLLNLYSLLEQLNHLKQKGAKKPDFIQNFIQKISSLENEVIGLIEQHKKGILPETFKLDDLKSFFSKLIEDGDQPASYWRDRLKNLSLIPPEQRTDTDVIEGAIAGKHIVEEVNNLAGRNLNGDALIHIKELMAFDPNASEFFQNMYNDLSFLKHNQVAHLASNMTLDVLENFVQGMKYSPYRSIGLAFLKTVQLCNIVMPDALALAFQGLYKACEGKSLIFSKQANMLMSNHLDNINPFSKNYKIGNETAVVVGVQLFLKAIEYLPLNRIVSKKYVQTAEQIRSTVIYSGHLGFRIFSVVRAGIGLVNNIIDKAHTDSTSSHVIAIVTAVLDIGFYAYEKYTSMRGKLLKISIIISIKKGHLL